MISIDDSLSHHYCHNRKSCKNYRLILRETDGLDWPRLQKSSTDPSPRACRIISLFELPQEDSGDEVRLTLDRPHRPRPTPTDPLRLTWSNWVVRRIARVVPSRSESPDRASSSDQSSPKGCPRRQGYDFRRFWKDFGINFRKFSRLHCMSDSTHSAKGRTSVFAGSAVLSRVRGLCRKTEKQLKLMENCCDYALQVRCTTKLDFFAPRCDLATILVALAPPERSWALFLLSQRVFGELLGAPRGRWARSGTEPGHSRDAFGTLLDDTRCPEKAREQH